MTDAPRPADPVPPPKRPERRAGIALGMLIAVVLHVVVQFAVADAFDGMALVFLGVTQIAYLLPAGLIAKWKGRGDIGLGILLVGCITFLLNASAAGALFVFVQVFCKSGI